MMKELMEEAKRLGEHIDTEWAEEHGDEYDALMARLDALYESGEIDGDEYNEIADVAFYDYIPKETPAYLARWEEVEA